jgi:hypothetical protein
MQLGVLNRACKGYSNVVAHPLCGGLNVVGTTVAERTSEFNSSSIRDLRLESSQVEPSVEACPDCFFFPLYSREVLGWYLCVTSTSFTASLT